MQNQQLSDVKGKELVAAGHAFAKAIGMDTPLIEIAKMVSVLATRLDCALVRGDACMQAEMVWEKAMMAAIGEDGVGCVVRAIAELKAERDALAAETNWWKPDRCPVTNRPFFLWIEHPSGGMVPTYGGPYDSYTIPTVDSDGEFCCERYDHDEGAWVDSECLSVRLTDDREPAVDYAFLNSVRAEGVERVKAHPAISLCSLTHVCEEIAAQLRAGKDGE